MGAASYLGNWPPPRAFLFHLLFTPYEKGAFGMTSYCTQYVPFAFPTSSQFQNVGQSEKSEHVVVQ